MAPIIKAPANINSQSRRRGGNNLLMHFYSSTLSKTMEPVTGRRSSRL
jgi:hypothetical protein